MFKLLKIGGVRVLYLSIMLGGMALGFAKWVFFSAMLPPADFGVYSTLITTIAFLSYFGAFGLNEYLIKEGATLAGSGRYEKLYKIREEIFFVCLINCAIVVILSLLFSRLVVGFQFEVRQYAIMAGVLFVTVIFNVTDAGLRASLRSLPFAGMVFIRALLLLFFGYFFATSYGLFGVLMAEFFSAVLAIFFAFYVVGPRPKIIHENFTLSIFIVYLRSGFSFLGLQTFRYFSFVVDKWLVGWYLGSAALGYYSFAMIVFLAFIGFAGIYNAVVIPKIIARFGGNSDIKLVYGSTVRQAVAFLGASTLFLPIFLMLAWFLVEYLLSQYIFDDMLWCLALIYLGSALHVSHSFFDSFFYSLNRQGELSVIAAFSLGIFIVAYCISGVLIPGVLSFCMAFFVAKIILFATTFLRVSLAFERSLLMK